MKALWLKYSQNDIAIAGLIYLIALIISISFVLSHSVASDHSVAEYDVYQQILKSGGWVNIPGSNVVSCLMSGFIPAMLQLFFNFSNEILIFDIFPLFFFAMMPAFVYLIARTQLNRGYSLCAAGLVLASSTFMYPNGRVGIALGFLSGMVWAIMIGHLKLSILFAIFLPFSHYGTHYIAMAFLIAPTVFYLGTWIKNRYKLLSVAIPLLVLVALSIFWHGFIFTMPAESAKVFIRNSADSVASGEVYAVDSREELIQHAFGKSLADFTVKRKIGWVTSWLTVILLSLGLLYTLRKRLFSQTHRIIAVVAYGLIVATVVVPYISTHYGVGRVYYVGLILLAPMFGQGLDMVFSKFRANGAWIGFALLLLLSWSTSGIVGRF